MGNGKKKASSMRIGIDARLYQESGIGRYIRNLISNLQKQDKKNSYFIFCLKKDYDSIPDASNFTKVVTNIKWYSFREQLFFPAIISQHQIDLMHFPHFNVPIFYRGRYVVTIHDLIHQHFSMQRSSTHAPFIFGIKKKGYDLSLSNALKRSEKIIVPSVYVKNCLIGECNVNPKKIVVTLEGVEKEIISISKKITSLKIDETLKKFNIRPPFIFYLGNAHPHKNVEGLIEAFLILRKKYQYLTLILSGSDHYFWKRIKQTFQHKDIIYTGFITDEEMVAIYKKAECRVIPSFEEGFGIPVLESFACGCPVVCSNVASLPEIARDGALYFDPANVSDISTKIREVINSKKVQAELSAKGLKYLNDFSWEKMTEQTLKIYNTKL